MPEILLVCIAGGVLLGVLAVTYGYYLYQLYVRVRPV